MQHDQQAAVDGWAPGNRSFHYRVWELNGTLDSSAGII